MKHPPAAPNRTTLLTVAALASVLAAGCGADAEHSGFTVVEELRGDTVVMVSSGEVERVRVEEAEAFWRSDDLALEIYFMRVMALVGDHLVIGDGDRVHVVSTRNGTAHSFGRRGEGPGEFTRIQLVGELGPDTIGVFDFQFQRVSLFSMEGGLLDSYRVTSPPLFNPDSWVHPLVKSGNGILWTMREWGEVGDEVGKLQKALVWHDLEADTAAVLDVRPWQENEMHPQGFSRTRDIFPDRVVDAIGSDGRVASGDPAEYCIRLFKAFEEGVRMACRERSRVPVKAGFHAPDFDLIEPRPGRIVDDWVAWQHRVDFLPHFDQILFSESGDLWVRTYHEERAQSHPLLFQPGWGLGPNHPLHPTMWEWDVFDAEGILVRQVTLPATFDLRVILDGEAFGFLFLETGEIAIGRVDLTEAVRVAS